MVHQKVILESMSKEHNSEGRMESLQSYQQRNECWELPPQLSFLRNKSFNELKESKFHEPYEFYKQTDQSSSGSKARSQLPIEKYHSSHVLCSKLASLDSMCFQFFNAGTSRHHLQTTPSHCLECGPLETYLDS